MSSQNEAELKSADKNYVSLENQEIRAPNITDESREWEKQTITNRFMFYKIFSSYPDACKRLLEILLGIKIAKIEYPLGEKDFEADIDSHAIRVDIYTEDENRVYDIEMQSEFEDDLPERARYYQALMDIDKLKAGEPYKNLKDSIVIFICKFDPFGARKPKYEFRNLDVSDRKTELGDRTTKIFFNVKEYDKITGDEELKSLLKYFSENRSGDNFTDSLDNLVAVARRNAQWRQTFMTKERFEYYAEKHGYKRGIAQQKAEDEKLLQQTVAQVTAQKDTELSRQAEEIAALKAQLAEALKK